MSFLETPRFPEDISLGSTGGAGYNTTITPFTSGKESRNINWAESRAEYDVAYGIKTQAQLYSLIELFHVMAGRGHGFRYKDWDDWNSSTDQTHGATVSDTDQTIGTGDDVEVDFQLIKTYTKGALSRSRDIRKPVVGTVVVSLDGVPQVSGWSVDTTTGIITFVAPPGMGVVVKAGYEFDVPVRFDIDKLLVLFESYELQSTSVPLIEIRV